MVGYSTKVGRGDRVLLMTDVSVPFDMNRAVIEAVRQAGGTLLEPQILNARLSAAARIGCTPRQLRVDAAAQLVRYLGADVRIALRSYQNPNELKDVPADDNQRFDQVYVGFVLDEGIEGTRWVLTEWPTEGFAVLAGLTTSEAEDYFFDAVLDDYPAMARNVVPLQRLMEQTDKVRIVGPDTDLTFSIKGIPVIPCTGEKNIPDGECYTAPVLDSADGRIQFNTISNTKSGDRYEGVGFEVVKGRIVREWCRVGNTERLTKILDTDDGARRFGEFSLGFNRRILRAIGDTLFDEKIDGSLHFTPGRAYDNAPNGNSSAIHWDLVLVQRPECGGGEIWFDGVLIRKDGIFVLEELAGLNPPRS